MQFYEGERSIQFHFCNTVGSGGARRIPHVIHNLSVEFPALFDSRGSKIGVPTYKNEVNLEMTVKMNFKVTGKITVVCAH